MNILKSSYENKSVLGEIDSCIELLCMEQGRCTPTDVLRFLGYTECKELRKLVLDRAIWLEFDVKSSGRGYAILDAIDSR